MTDMVRQCLYLAYFAKHSDWRRLRRQMPWWAWPDVLRSSLMHKTSFEEYLDFQFATKGEGERGEWLGMGRLYEIQSALNAKKDRTHFRDKWLFHRTFQAYTGRQVLYVPEVKPEVAQAWLDTRGRAVAKPRYGQTGQGVRRIAARDFRSGPQLCKELRRAGTDLLEECIVQHPAMATLVSTSVNTARVITVVTGAEVDIIGTILRMGMDGFVDNLSAGGLAAPLDDKRGIVTGPAVRKGPGRFHWHPVTGTPIVGFHVPEWQNVRELVIQAARVVPTVRTVGWDVAITPTGPILVEGNDNWGRTLWQIPEGHGKRAVLERHMDSVSRAPVQVRR